MSSSSQSSVPIAHILHESSTALRNTRLHQVTAGHAGTVADFVGFTTLQGVDPELHPRIGPMRPRGSAWVLKTRGRAVFGLLMSFYIIAKFFRPMEEIINR